MWSCENGVDAAWWVMKLKLCDKVSMRGVAGGKGHVDFSFNVMCRWLEKGLISRGEWFAGGLSTWGKTSPLFSVTYLSHNILHWPIWTPSLQRNHPIVQMCHRTVQMNMSPYCQKQVALKPSCTKEWQVTKRDSCLHSPIALAYTIIHTFQSEGEMLQLMKNAMKQLQLSIFLSASITTE